jgi:hypothetical protein
MRRTTPRCLFVLLILIAMLKPLAALAAQDAAAAAQPALSSGGSSRGSSWLPSHLPAFAPLAIRRTRVALYFQAARDPLIKLAPQVYELASNSERCRLKSGAKACGLPAEPLKGTDLKQIFKYYVKVPVEARLERQQLDIHKSDWTWQPYYSRPGN